MRRNGIGALAALAVGVSLGNGEGFSASSTGAGEGVTRAKARLDAARARQPRAVEVVTRQQRRFDEREAAKDPMRWARNK